MNRKEDGLCRNFAKLHSPNAPTGNPFMEPITTRAKAARQLILEKADMGGAHINSIGLSDDEQVDGELEVLPLAQTPSPSLENATPSTLPVSGQGSPVNLSPCPIVAKRSFRRRESNVSEATELLRIQLAQDAKRYEEERKERREQFEMDRKDRLDMERSRLEREDRERKERNEREDKRSQEFMLLIAAISKKN